MIRKGDHKKIFYHFKPFYVHRVQFIGLNKDYKKSVFDSYEPGSEIKQKPDISEKTTMLADKKRKKLLGGKDTAQVSKVEIFLLPKVDESKIKLKKQQLEQKEMQGCTFSPETLNYKGSAQKSGGVTHGDRNLDLYSKKPKGWFKDRKQKTKEDYEIERGGEDLTFAPVINDPEAVEKILQKNK